MATKLPRFENMVCEIADTTANLQLFIFFQKMSIQRLAKIEERR